LSCLAARSSASDVSKLYLRLISVVCFTYRVSSSSVLRTTCLEDRLRKKKLKKRLIIINQFNKTLDLFRP